MPAAQTEDVFPTALPAERVVLWEKETRLNQMLLVFVQNEAAECLELTINL